MVNVVHTKLFQIFIVKKNYKNELDKWIKMNKKIIYCEEIKIKLHSFNLS